MKWVSRGPYNVGGRTKGLMFDPNDESDETVVVKDVATRARIAAINATLVAAVSGGLLTEF